jgi:hydrogenase maturation protease
MALIIGYGNPLRSDDGLGQYLAQGLAHRWQVISLTQLLPELAQPISVAQRVVFIDAGIGAAAGEITCEKVEPLETVGAFTHQVTPASLLAAAQALYGAAPDAILITISGASFEYGCEFSATIYSQLPQIIRQVEAIINRFLQQVEAAP